MGNIFLIYILSMNKYEQHLQHNIIELHCQLSTVDDTWIGFGQASRSILWMLLLIQLGTSFGCRWKNV